MLSTVAEKGVKMEVVNIPSIDPSKLDVSLTLSTLLGLVNPVLSLPLPRMRIAIYGTMRVGLTCSQLAIGWLTTRSLELGSDLGMLRRRPRDLVLRRRAGGRSLTRSYG